LQELFKIEDQPIPLCDLAAFFSGSICQITCRLCHMPGYTPKTMFWVLHSSRAYFKVF